MFGWMLLHSDDGSDGDSNIDLGHADGLRGGGTCNDGTTLP